MRLALLALALLALAGCTNGAIGSPAGTTDPAAIPVNDLEVGDCIEYPEVESTYLALRRMSCAKPHGAEIIWAADLWVGRDEPYPDEESRDGAVIEVCEAAFADRFGVAEEDEPTWSYEWLDVSEEAWAAGSRHFSCYAFRRDGEPFLNAP